jgi:hypothetical protein
MKNNETTIASLKAALTKSVRQQDIVRCRVTQLSNGLRAVSQIADVEGYVEVDDPKPGSTLRLLDVWGRTWAGDCFRLHLIAA